MKLEQYLKIIEQFLVDTLANTKASGYVLGLSGGVDSSLLAAMVNQVLPTSLTGLILPIESDIQDINDAKLVAKTFNIKYHLIDLTSTYLTLLNTIKENHFQIEAIVKMNLKVRLRMVTLYAFAQMENKLVLGTDNLSEYYTGYFTKFGDGAADLLPLVHLLKKEVFLAASLYKVPPHIINITPSAGLFNGQTDEGDMGFSYEQLDRYLLNQPIEECVKDKIDYLHLRSEHKRLPIRRPIAFDRD